MAKVGAINYRHKCVADDLEGSGTFFAFAEDSYPKNRQHLLDECVEHAGNTCCMMKHVDQITAKLNFIKVEEAVSAECLARTREVMCSLCDGDVGT